MYYKIYIIDKSNVTKILIRDINISNYIKLY